MENEVMKESSLRQQTSFNGNFEAQAFYNRHQRNLTDQMKNLKHFFKEMGHHLKTMI